MCYAMHTKSGIKLNDINYKLHNSEPVSIFCSLDIISKDKRFYYFFEHIKKRTHFSLLRQSFPQNNSLLTCKIFFDVSITIMNKEICWTIMI